MHAGPPPQPALALLQPALAESVVTYRLHRLPGARAKALSYSGAGYRGAMFPWESAFTGVETCPSWAPTGLKEVHISADIAVSVWQYWQSTRDIHSGWLREVGFPLLAAIADFWVSRLAADSPGAVIAGYNDGSVGSPVLPTTTQSEDAGTCALHITGIIPPTEYYHNVADSVYTNAAVAAALTRAVAAAAELGITPAVSPAVASWANASTRVYIPFREGDASRAPGWPANIAAAPNGGLHPYFSGYKFGSDKVQLLDVAMLGWPLGALDTSTMSNATSAARRAVGLDRDTYLNDLAYYAENQVRHCMRCHVGAQ